MQGSEPHAPLLVGKGSGGVGVDHPPGGHGDTVALHHQPCTPVTTKDISSAQIFTGSHYIIYIRKKVHVVLVKVQVEHASRHM